MVLRTAEYPQLMETVTYTSQNTQNAWTATVVRHGMAAMIVVLKRAPVNRDEATDEINPANGVLRPTQALILSRVVGKRKFVVQNERVDTL